MLLEELTPMGNEKRKSFLIGKISEMEKAENSMLAGNKYYMEHGTLEGCPEIDAEMAKRIDATLKSNKGKIPFKPEHIKIVKAEKRRLERRLKMLEFKISGGKNKARKEPER